MAVPFDFPDSPTLNEEVVAVGGIVYIWDGIKWISGVAPMVYLPIAGGTMTGPLILARDPQLPMEAATMQWVENYVTGRATLPAGSNTQIQYNNNGAFGASSGFTWNDANTTLTVSGSASTRGAVLNLRSQAPLNFFPESTINVYADAVSTADPYTNLRLLAGDGIAAPTIQIGIAPSVGSPPAYIWQLTSTSMDVNGVLSVQPSFASSYAFLVKTNGLNRLAVDNNNGNVGIWTTEPYSPLHVRAGISSVLSALNSDTVLFLEHSSNAYLEMVCFGVQAGLLLGGNADTNSSQVMDFWDGANHNLKLVTNPPGSYMSFFTEGEERMRLTAEGNLGIGTTTPGALLQVYSATGAPVIRLEGGAGATLFPLLQLVDGRAVGGGAAWNIENGREAPGTLGFFGAAPPSKVVFTSAGDVGVGTPSPSARLDIVGAAGGTPGINPIVRMGGVTGNVLEMGAYQGAPFAVWLQTRDRSVPYGYPLQLNPLGGNVSIGTTEPIPHTLHVEGDTSIEYHLYLGGNSYVAGGYFGPTSTGSAPILFCPNDVSTAPGQPLSTLCFSLNTAAHSLFIQVRLGNGTYASAAIPLT